MYLCKVLKKNSKGGVMPTIIIKKLSRKQASERGIDRWPIWEKGVSRFDWVYDGTEQCYILEGEVMVETDHGVFRIVKDDFVTFEDGLKCTWDIKQAIRKHYNFK
jgi:uncharacterized cupin superfamily protein